MNVFVVESREFAAANQTGAGTRSMNTESLKSRDIQHFITFSNKNTRYNSNSKLCLINFHQYSTTMPADKGSRVINHPRKVIKS